MSFTAALRDLNKLNTFVRVAQRRSFTNAAAELRTRPSVVSKRIKELEDDLGFRLINRSTHGLALTEAGEGLFAHCLQMLGELDDYVIERRNLEAGPYGTLRVQATGDFARAILAPLAVRFVDQHPRIRVQLAVVPDNFTAAEDGVDVIVSSRKPAVPGVVGFRRFAFADAVLGSSEMPPQYLSMMDFKTDSVEQFSVRLDRAGDRSPNPDAFDRAHAWRQLYQEAGPSIVGGQQH